MSDIASFQFGHLSSELKTLLMNTEYKYDSIPRLNAPLGK